MVSSRWASARQNDGATGLLEEDVEALQKATDYELSTDLNQNFAPDYDHDVYERYYYKAGQSYFVVTHVRQTESEIRLGLGSLAVLDSELDIISIYMF